MKDLTMTCPCAYTATFGDATTLAVISTELGDDAGAEPCAAAYSTAPSPVDLSPTSLHTPRPERPRFDPASRPCRIAPKSLDHLSPAARQAIAWLKAWRAGRQSA